MIRWNKSRRSEKSRVRRPRLRLQVEALEERELLSCAAPANEIEAENCLAGNPPSEWDIVGAGDSSIQGFATDISVNKGERVRFKVDTTASDYRLDIYRIGYYGGLGARKVTTVQPSVSLPQAQPDCLSELETGLYDCGNWAVSASWLVPTTAVSGVYIAKLVRESGPAGSSHIIFIVRDDTGSSDLLFQTADATWQSYNNYGGKSMYLPSREQRAYKLSYNRPFETRGLAGGGGEASWFFSAEYPMVRWLEANAYDVSYFTNVDADRFGSEILEHQVFLSVGHDEYWSGTQRANVEAARDAGVNLAFFSGNEVYWKTRWESSIDGSGTSHRTLVSYKETHDNAKIDPLPTVWTGTWRDPRFSPPADGGRPENALTGTIFTVNRGPGGNFGTPIQVPEAEGKMRFWRNTSVATLGSGQVAILSNFTLGYEWDEDLDNGFRPAGLIRLSSTTEDVPQKLLDYGNTVGAGTATHSLTLYRAASGALVFGAGTVQWSWGLDGTHDRALSVADVRMQQATVNLFADMGVQPARLQAGLVPATASTDFVKPTASILSPVDGAVIQSGTVVTVTGTASDSGGGVVGGVEVSTDGGATWHRATGRTNWTYVFTPQANGDVAILSRAVDDSGNLQTLLSSVAVTIVLDQDTAPQISAVTVRPISNSSMTVTWTTDEASNSRVDYGTSPTQLTRTASNASPVTAHSITLTALTPNTTYYYRVSSTDEFNNTSILPATNDPPATFQTAAFLDASTSDFAAGQLGTGTYLAQTTNGDIILAPTSGAEFSGTALPSDWFSTAWGAGGNSTVGSGALTVNGARSGTNALFGPGRSVEFVATFTGDAFQHAGLATDLTNPPWLLFSTKSGGALYARSRNGAAIDTQLVGNYLGAPHRFRIDWNSSTASFWIDGILVATHAVSIATSMRPLISDLTVGSGTIAVDWVRTTPYAAAGSFTSRVFAATQPVTWTNINWTASTPAGSNVVLSVRGGNTATPDANWTDFIPLSGPGAATAGKSQYLQYRADLTTSVPGATPSLEDVSLSHVTTPDSVDPTIVQRSPLPGATGVPITTPVTVRFSELMNASTITTATVRIRRSGGSSDIPAGVSFAGATATLQPTAPLVAATSYVVTVSGSVADLSGNTLGSDATWTFTTPTSLTDTTVTDFARGTVGNGNSISDTAGGEVILLPTAGAEFSGTSLPTGWSSATWKTGGTATVAGGGVAADAARVSTDALYAPGRSLEFVSTFSGDLSQHAGFAVDLTNVPWAIFSVTDGNLSVRSRSPFASASTSLGPNWLGAPHRFRIDWTSSQVKYSIDGVQVALHTVAITSNMRPIASDYNLGSPLVVDWMRMTPYATVATRFTSQVLDGGGPITWTNAVWSTDTPAGTSVIMRVRTGNTAVPDATWTNFVTLNSSGAAIGAVARYLQYRADLNTTDVAQTPALRDMTVQISAGDTIAPSIVSRSPDAGLTGIDPATSVDVTFSEIMNAATINTSTLRLRAVGALSDVVATVSYAGSTATLTPAAALAEATTYQVTVSGSVADVAGNTLGGASVWTFTTRDPIPLTVGDTTAVDFAAGSGTGTYVSQTGDGELTLSPVVAAEFTGSALPADWTSTPWNAGGAAVVGGGTLAVDGSLVATNALYGPGRSLEFVATFSGAAFQHAGFLVDLTAAPWAIFSTGPGGILLARTNGGTMIDTTLSSSLLGTQHRYRIDWSPAGIAYFVDGTLVATHAVAIATAMRPGISDFTIGSGSVAVEWLRMSPYSAAGSFTSRVFDAGSSVTWTTLSFTNQLPAGTSLVVSVRTGNTATPDGTWTSFVTLAGSGSNVGATARYLQYRVDLTTSDLNQTPVLQDVTVAYVA
jgi:hypothetical protein